MDEKIENNNDVLLQQVEQMNKQGEFIQRAVARIVGVEREVKEISERTSERLKIIEDSYTLLESEADKIQAAVYKKAHEITKEFLGKDVSHELYSQKFGHIITGIYSQIKRVFKVRKYTLVKHIQAEQALNYVLSIEMEDLSSNYLRLTDKQKETAKKYNDNIIYQNISFEL